VIERPLGVIGHVGRPRDRLSVGIGPLARRLGFLVVAAAGGGGGEPCAEQEPGAGCRWKRTKHGISLVERRDRRPRPRGAHPSSTSRAKRNALQISEKALVAAWPVPARPWPRPTATGCGTSRDQQSAASGRSHQALPTTACWLPTAWFGIPNPALSRCATISPREPIG